MINKINELKKQIGKPYQMFWEGSENLYQGCFYPIYYIYDYLPKYPLYSEHMADNWDYGINLIEKHCFEVKKDEVKAGDMLVTKFRNELHVALAIDESRIIHVFKDHTLQINRRDFFKERLVKWYRFNDI